MANIQRKCPENQPVRNFVNLWLTRLITSVLVGVDRARCVPGMKKAGSPETATCHNHRKGDFP